MGPARRTCPLEAPLQHTEAESELRALMLRGLDGDQVAYRALLERLSRHLRAFFLRRLQGWPDDVEDLVQECLLAMHNQRHTYQSNQPLTAWVYAIARYKWVDHLRAHGRREKLHDDIDDWAETLSVDGDTEASDAQRDLAQVLADFRRVLL